MLDLRTLLARYLIHGALVTRTPRRERPGSDVVLEQLLVDDVDHGRDQGFDVLAA